MKASFNTTQYNCSGYALGTYKCMTMTETVHLCRTKYLTEALLPMCERYYLWIWDGRSIDNITGKVIDYKDFHIVLGHLCIVT